VVVEAGSRGFAPSAKALLTGWRSDVPHRQKVQWALVSLRVYIDESGSRRTHKFGMNGRCGSDHRVGRSVSIDTVLSIPIPYRRPTGQRAWGGLCTDRLLGVCIRIRE